MTAAGAWAERRPLRQQDARTSRRPRSSSSTARSTTLMEADPHTWAIPRLRRRAEGRRSSRSRPTSTAAAGPSACTARCSPARCAARGWSTSTGTTSTACPPVTLAALNVMSLFGLHRRLRGAIAGHLAAFEMTSSLPNRLYGDGFRRLGHDEATTEYFDEHVEADAVHEQIAGRDLAGRLAEQRARPRAATSSSGRPRACTSTTSSGSTCSTPGRPARRRCVRHDRARAAAGDDRGVSERPAPRPG